MPNWSALAGMSGFAAALDEIQNRRIKEAQLQRELTAGQGEWTPATGGGGGIGGFFDALLGHNTPGQIGFGSQRYQFQPYEPVTEQQARAWGMTYPEETQVPGLDMPSRNAAAPGSQPTFGAPAAALARQTPDMTYTAADTSAYPFTTVTAPPRTITEEKPMPGIVGMRLGPKEKMALFQEQLKERRELAKLEREQAILKDFNVGGFRVGTGTTGTTPLPPETSGAAAPTDTGAPTSTPTPAAPTPAVQSAIPGTDKTSPQFMAKAQKMSTDLGMRLDDFLRVISYETDGTFSPSQTNIGQKSSAVGLIQFLSRTAKNLGTTTEALAAMSPEQQLDYVAKYLAPYKGKIGNLQDLYMAILSPASIGKSGNAVVFSKEKNPAEYAANAPLDVDKKGTITVSDALNAVMRKTGGTATAQAPLPAQPDTSMMVAGPAAPAPKPGTAAAAPQPAQGTAAAQAPDQIQTQAPATPPQAPFALSLEGRRQILANNVTIQRNNQEIQALDAKQRAANYLAATRKNPQLGAMAVQIGQRIADLSRDNQSLRDMSEKTLQDEAREWRLKGEKLAERLRRPEELKREKTAEKEAEQHFREGQTLYDAVKDDATLFRDPMTGNPVDETQTYRDVQVAQKRKVDGVPQVVRVTKDQQERLEAVESALPRVQRIQQYVDQLYGPNGVYATLGPGQRAEIATHGWQVLYKEHPEIEAAAKYISANAEALARAIAGVKGAATEGDVQRARDMVATIKASFSVWPPSRFGISLPDTRAVALRTMNDLVTTLEGTTGQVLRNPNFRYPTLRRYEIAEEPRVPSGRTPAPTTTQATGLNPTWVQQRLPAMSPDAIRTAPLEVIRDVNRPSDIPGLDTEQRKALAERLRQRSAEAVARTRPKIPAGRWAISP